MSKLAIGIDLGTTYSAVAVYRNGNVEIIQNKQGKRTMPSCVAFTDKGSLVGDTAYFQAPTNPENTIYAVKRLMGRNYNDKSVQRDIKNWPFKVDEKDDKIHIQVRCRGETELYYPEEMSAMILEDLKKTAENYLEQEVTDAVITVPAYFNDAQRTATRAAAQIAGLNPLRIINEPTAAALAYGIRGVAKQKALIFDFGGGTFDITIMDIADKNFEVIATKGDSHLGGEDIDQRLIDYFVEEFKETIDISKDAGLLIQLKRDCEHVKRMLSSSTETMLTLKTTLKKTITRACFEELSYDLFEKAIKLVDDALNDANLVKSDIETILLVGGTTRVPKVRELLSNYFDGKPLNQTINPDEAVAIGAAYQAAILTEGQLCSTLKGIKLADVCPLSLGIQVQWGIHSCVIERNTRIPVKKTKPYFTTRDNQISASIAVHEGERFMAKDNHYLGEFDLEGIPAAPAGEGTLDCSFEIDEDGILTVYAVEPITGNKNQIVITNDSRLSPEEAKKIIDRADELRKETNMHQERLSALYLLEGMLYRAGHEAENYDGETRDEFEKEISQFKEWFMDNDLPSKSELEEKTGELQAYLDGFKGKNY